MEMQLDNDLHAIIKLMPAFGQHTHVAMGYCYLFGVSPLRLKAKKLRVLLEELRRLFETESFIYERRRYAISRAGIAEALDVMVKRNFSSTLTNHNYLKQVMMGIAEKEAHRASVEAEKVLKKKEEKLMAGKRESDNHNAPLWPDRNSMAEDVRKQIKKLTGEQ